MIKTHSVLSAVLVSAALALVTATASYFGHFSLYVVLFFIAYDYLNLFRFAKSKKVIIC